MAGLKFLLTKVVFQKASQVCKALCDIFKLPVHTQKTFIIASEHLEFLPDKLSYRLPTYLMDKLIN